MTRTKPSWKFIVLLTVVLGVTAWIEMNMNDNLIISYSERLNLIEACNRGEEEALEDYREIIRTHFLVISDGPVAKRLWAQVLPHLPFPSEIYKPLSERETPGTIIFSLILVAVFVEKIRIIFITNRKKEEVPVKRRYAVNYDRY